MKQAATIGFRSLHPEIMAGFVFEVARHLPRTAGAEPSMMIGDPQADDVRLEDQGRTLVVPADGIKKLYAKRDDLPEGPIVTFLLAEEY